MIKDNTEKILKELPKEVNLVAAAKFKTPKQIEQTITGGIKFIGENYIQEAEEDYATIGDKVKWHFIGHLQKNKAKRAVRIFDMIETLDSERLAKTLNKECRKINKVMPVLIEINSAEEPQKAGVLPAEVESFLKNISVYENIKVMGLMTMGPFLDDVEKIRPYFKITKDLFDKTKNLNIENTDFKYLSMGMSASYKIALEEGANIVRVGTAIFGPR